ncbi:MAG: gliding motility protein GldL [Fermentimonas sp.]|nr:gliding motility protein GldL [Fermentimonas sp.]
MNAYKRYKNRLENFLQTERGKRFINFAYSIGAAIVILGAMFKLLHFPFGNELLFIGMVTEVIVFTLSAFDTPIRDYNWDKVFPALTLERQEKTDAGDYALQPNQASQLNQTSHSSTNQPHRHSSEFPEANIDLSPQTIEYAKQMESLKNETEKMAQQLKELNEVYARMLNAMSTNRDH